MSSWKHKRIVKRRYDSTATMYDLRYAEEQETKYHIALDDVKPAGLVLDLGCGTGLLFSYVSRDAANIVGIDISRKMLEQARNHAKTLGNVDLVLADADHLPFKDSKFNSVFSFTVLQNMPKPFETLMEVRRVAQDAALLTVTGLKKSFSIGALEELLRDATLQVLSVKDDEKLRCYVASCFKKA